MESKCVQGTGLVKLVFHPGTDMSQALAQTISYVERARAFMPPGTVSPFVVRFDAGTVPVGYLVFSSESRNLSEIQDLALFKVNRLLLLCLASRRHLLLVVISGPLSCR